MRLRQTDKDSIVRKFVAAQTDEKTSALKRKVEEAGLAIYRELVSEKQRALMAKLPERFFISGREFSAKLSSERWSQGILLGGTYRIPECLRYGGETVSPEASALYLKATQELHDYKEKVEDLRLACARTIRGISTLKRLQEVWPEGAAFAPEEATVNRSVLVVTCDAITAALALV